ncbi:hypothetical protein BJ508DRAFT_379647 [Ascobolus immersus RN42]|uniref:Uncharacterized protein n=1 Tax=Ascobolus immersus RN42 TaxID=1160509 RepID=A0A3N4HVL4_ASCIM|nr:hypothetical protein BJ508DRAFT_379647 [Ascobolus immersus RN42]
MVLTGRTGYFARRSNTMSRSDYPTSSTLGSSFWQHDLRESTITRIGDRDITPKVEDGFKRALYRIIRNVAVAEPFNNLAPAYAWDQVKKRYPNASEPEQAEALRQITKDLKSGGDCYNESYKILDLLRDYADGNLSLAPGASVNQTQSEREETSHLFREFQICQTKRGSDSTLHTALILPDVVFRVQKGEAFFSKRGSIVIDVDLTRRALCVWEDQQDPYHAVGSIRLKHTVDESTFGRFEFKHVLGYGANESDYTQLLPTGMGISGTLIECIDDMQAFRDVEIPAIERTMDKDRKVVLMFWREYLPACLPIQVAGAPLNTDKSIITTYTLALRVPPWEKNAEERKFQLAKLMKQGDGTYKYDIRYFPFTEQGARSALRQIQLHSSHISNKNTAMLRNNNSPDRLKHLLLGSLNDHKANFEAIEQQLVWYVQQMVLLSGRINKIMKFDSV